MNENLAFVNGGTKLAVWWFACRSLLPLAKWRTSGLFGWKIAALVLGTGLAIAMVTGWAISRIGMERSVEPWVAEANGAPGVVGIGIMITRYFFNAVM